MPSILINGCENDQVSILDRGFQYGDGLFETLRVIAGVPQYWDSHMSRLFSGCRRLNISVADMSVFQTEADSLCSDVDEAVLKVMVTRGISGRGYAYTPVDSLAPSSTEDEQDTKPAASGRILALFPASQYPEDFWRRGVKVTVCETPLGENPVLAGLKHLNRLEQVLARAEWQDPEISEGLMLDIHGNVIEGTMTNVFIVKNGTLFTPELSLCGVQGIMRQQIMDTASALDMVVQETKLSLDDVYQADECFLSNSLVGIWPVRQLEAHLFVIGAVTKQLTSELDVAGNQSEDAA